MTEHLCTVCGEPMSESESMFKFHGYSGPCPKPPLPIARKVSIPVEITLEQADVLGIPKEVYEKIVRLAQGF